MNPTPDDILSRLEKHLDLGHAKRDGAFLRQVALACSNPGASPPSAAGKTARKLPLADAMSLYRFVGNEKGSLADLRAARAEASPSKAP